MLTFQSHGFGAFCFGREILKKFPQAEISFSVGSDKQTKSCFREETFWEIGLREILSNHTRFGRLACLYERKNKRAVNWQNDVDVSPFEYQPGDTRAEKKPQIHWLETQLLREIANEGWADSVEFRRLARKFVRQAKQANVDTIFFLDGILAEDLTRKILKHLVGSQIQIWFPSDFVFIEKEVANTLQKSDSKKRNIQVCHKDDIQFVKRRAEDILRTKLSLADFTEPTTD